METVGTFLYKSITSYLDCLRARSDLVIWNAQQEVNSDVIYYAAAERQRNTCNHAVIVA